MKVFVIEANDKFWNSTNHWSGSIPSIYTNRKIAERISKGTPSYFIVREDMDITDIKIVEYRLEKAPRDVRLLTK